jgi:glycosidase
VADEERDPASLLSLYRRALRVRKAEPALRRGSYRELAAPEPVFAFARTEPGAAEVFVAINTSTQPVSIALPEAGRVIVSTHDVDERETGRRLDLPPLGALWVRGEQS